MILCGIQDVKPGAVIGAPIPHPQAPATELLKAGYALDAWMLARLAKMGVSQMWIEDDVTADLDASVAVHLTQAKLEMFTRLKQDLKAASRQTVTSAQMQAYRASMVSLACMLIGNAKYASMADSLSGVDGAASHATNVAYLSILIGLELQAYIVKERPRLSAAHARDMGVLGLAGMLHDVGKTRMDAGAARHHEVNGPDKPGPGDYERHTLEAFALLSQGRAPAAVTQAVLNHHQRFDGNGWPDMAAATRNRKEGTQAGREIHIFTRIVSAANVLDNLLRGAEGRRVPPVAALHAFASSRFDGWFDPIVRRAALRRVPPFAVGSQVTLSDGRRAVVMAPNMAEPCQPAVRPLDPQKPGSKAPNPTIELRDTPALRITGYLGADVDQWLYSAARLGLVDDSEVTGEAHADPAPEHRRVA